MASSTRDNTKIRQKRPAQTGQLIGVRLQPDDLAALDSYLEASDEATRPQAIRAILHDWLAVHGFTKREILKDIEPKGPATEAVKAMEEAVKAFRKPKPRIASKERK